MYLLACLFGQLTALLAPLAGPYRMLAFKPRCFGSIHYGIGTWIGIGIVYPYVWATREEGGSVRGFTASWLLLAVMAWLHMFAQWCSGKPRREPDKSHAWFGPWEPAYALGLALTSMAATGTGAFLLYGYAASLLQILAAKLRHFGPEDYERAFAPVRRAVASTSARAATVATVAASSAATGGALVGKATLTAGKALAERRKAAPVEGKPARVGFWAGVSRHITAYFIIHLILGTISLWGLFRIVATTLTLPFVLIGGKIEAPESIKEDAQIVYDGARERASHYNPFRHREAEDE